MCRFLWYLLKERQFDGTAVEDLVALKEAMRLSSTEVAAALQERCLRIEKKYGNLMLSTEGALLCYMLGFLVHAYLLVLLCCCTAHCALRGSVASTCSALEASIVFRLRLCFAAIAHCLVKQSAAMLCAKGARVSRFFRYGFDCA